MQKQPKQVWMITWLIWKKIIYLLRMASWEWVCMCVYKKKTTEKLYASPHSSFSIIFAFTFILFMKRPSPHSHEREK